MMAGKEREGDYHLVLGGSGAGLVAHERLRGPLFLVREGFIGGLMEWCPLSSMMDWIWYVVEKIRSDTALAQDLL